MQDFLCDIFLSLRFIFCGIFMMACAMIVTLNHGNINVVFSVVALAFVLEIDGKISLLYILPCIFIFSVVALAFILDILEAMY